MLKYDAVALFSAGLDSLLAAKMIMAQGLTVKCLHFTSPFFGKPEKIPHWRAIHGLDIEAVDIGEAYVKMMLAGPKFGFGKFFNPCVDCKIIMLSHARRLMERFGATFIISGEVVGQRPMSQRRDAMNSVRNESETKDILLRPLCAKQLDPTPMEESGLVDRERLCGIFGRGRSEQQAMAKDFGITEIPTPGGGCLLTESASARRYGPVFEHIKTPTADDFHLANAGRQLWAGTHWLSMGRNQGSNDRLSALAREDDLIFDVRDFPGPRGVGRQIGDDWSATAVAEAAALVASYAPKSVRLGGPVVVTISHRGAQYTVSVEPSRTPAMGWVETSWEDAQPTRNRMDTQDR
ncbi:MAG: tRNA(5-methylaminomethyl-2-thiouridylate) methyltransferase [Proteobacteria bacterium]|nr:tRNA(5-methylaminomethyl-2-thiouridylate) methyltransferase [Pseudomonadota bacterium]